MFRPMSLPQMNAHLSSLQGVRAVAALMVVAFHLNVYILPDVLSGDRLWTAFSAGYAGVEIFFVLSGFIMMLVRRRAFGKAGGWVTFLVRRVRRIYPFYWITLGAVVAARLAVDGFDALPSLEMFASSLFLIPAQHRIIEVSWSLSFEMLFYLVFSISLLNLTLGKALGAAWFGATALLLLIGAETAFTEFFFSPYNLLFLFGIIAASRYQSSGVGTAWALLVVGAAVFGATALGDVYGFLPLAFGVRTVLLGAGAAAMIAGLAALEWNKALRTPGWIVLLGDASYAIYLLHISAMTACAKLIIAFGLADQVTPWLLFGIIFVAAVGSGVLAHLLIEMPLLRWLATRRKSAVTEPLPETAEAGASQNYRSS
jgi:peptidoglycan/LPS O-acetylase OafA/YrhL